MPRPARSPAEVLTQAFLCSTSIRPARETRCTYLLENGMSRAEYHWFLTHRLKQHCILGNDYYITNEHRVYADGHTEASGEVFGYSEITRQYHDRYRLPVMHTETNFKEGPTGQEAVYWLWKMGHVRHPQCRHPRSASPGIASPPWTGLGARQKNDRVHPWAFSTSTPYPPVVEAYKQLRQLRTYCRRRSCAFVPIVLPSRADRVYFQEQRSSAHRYGLRHSKPQIPSERMRGAHEDLRIRPSRPPRWLFVRVERRARSLGRASLRHVEASTALSALRDRSWPRSLPSRMPAGRLSRLLLRGGRWSDSALGGSTGAWD